MRSGKKKVVITSTGDNFRALKTGAGRRGLEVVSFPTIEIRPARFAVPGEAHDWVVFTSKNAVELFVKKAGKAYFRGRRIAAIGAGTAALLARKGLRAEFTPERPGSEDFVKEFSGRFEVTGRKFLLPVSSKAGDTIEAGLRGKGGKVRALVVYRTGRPRVSREAVRKFVEKGPYHFIFFSSPSAFENFARIKGLAELLGGVRTAAIGPATAAAMRSRGVKPEITGRKASFEDVLEEIMLYKGGKL